MNVRVTAETDMAITLGWDAVQGAAGFIFAIDGDEHLADGKRHFTMDGTRTAVKLAKPTDGKPHTYTVEALGIVGTGSVVSPAPPPTATTRQGNGFLCNLQGSQYAKMTDAERANYGGMIVGFGDYAGAATFAKAHGTHAYGYHTSVESSGGHFWYGAVDDAVARANGWVLKTPAGVEITNGYELLMCDISNPAYQKAWCDYVRSQDALDGVTGQFLDNVTGTLMVGSWFKEGTPAGWTDATLQDAYVAMLKAQQAQLAGIYRLANFYAPNRSAWLTKILPYIDGALIEYFDGSADHMACVTQIQAAGRDAWALVDPGRQGASPDNAAGVALAQKFRSVWDGKGGGFGFNGVNVWRTGAGSWTAAIKA